MTNQKQKRSKESLLLMNQIIQQSIKKTLEEEKEELIQADLKKAKNLSEEGNKK